MKKHRLMIIGGISAAIAIFLAIYYYNRNIMYFEYNDLTNFSVNRKILNRNVSDFHVAGSHVGHIGSIGKTKIIHYKNEINILLKRDFFVDDDRSGEYVYSFRTSYSPAIVTFGPSRKVIWTNKK